MNEIDDLENETKLNMLRAEIKRLTSEYYNLRKSFLLIMSCIIKDADKEEIRIPMNSLRAVNRYTVESFQDYKTDEYVFRLIRG